MKKQFFLLAALAIGMVGFQSCNKDGEDLTVEIAGEYIGGYGTIGGTNINPFEVVVSKVNNNTIRIRPKAGNEFAEWEIKLERANETTIVSPIASSQQLNASVIFTLGAPAVGFTFQRTAIGDTFVGEKQ